MITLFEALPNILKIDGKAYAIYTDFRVWMRFCVEYESFMDNGGSGVLDISYLFKNELPIFKKPSNYTPILEFAFPKNIVPRGSGKGEKVLDYIIDSDYIYSAFMQEYGIDLCEVELHWHKFRALLNGISQNTMLHSIMEYRSYTGEKIKDQEEIYRRLKSAWELPLKMTEEEIKNNEEFEQHFGM